MIEKYVDFGKPDYNLTIDTTINIGPTKTPPSEDDKKYFAAFEFFEQFLGTRMHVTDENYLFSDHNLRIDRKQHRRALLKFTPQNIELLLTLKGHIIQRSNSKLGDNFPQIIFKEGKIGHISAKNSHLYLTEYS